MSAINIMDKEADVQKLLRILNDNLKTGALSDGILYDILGQLKVYGRDVRGADGIYSRAGIETICKYAFADYRPNVSQEALRCIANALLLQPQLRSTFVNSGYAASVVKTYKGQNNEDEFLGARILFLLTYGTKADFTDLLASHGLAETIEKHLTRHASVETQDDRPTEQMDNMAMSESLKLVFNLTNYCPSEVDMISVAVPAICTILLKTQVSPTPLEAPLGLMVNALAILNLVATSTPSAADILQKQYTELVSKLAEVLEKSIKRYDALQLDTQAIPLITVLRKLYEAGSIDVKLRLQKLLLPDDKERDLPLGQSSSLPSHLLRLTTSPGLSNLPDAISALMFQMSDEDPSIFIKNIGYGYAAGYLMTHDIPIPESVKQSRTANIKNEVPINPVTGQRLDKEDSPDLPEMTQEEKEREAERLFVLFERLRATGVVDVKNPVQQAMEEGRLEEVDSDPD